MKKTIIDWEQAAKDRAICYFWDEHKPEKPIVGRITYYFKETYPSFQKDNENYDVYKNCELIFDSDKNKYIKTVWEGRDNFIKALKERKSMKVKVKQMESIELQEIAIENNVYYCVNKSAGIINSSGFLFFDNFIVFSVDEEHFSSIDSYIEYFPETDSFTLPEEEYRPCENWEEFKKFSDKWIKPKDSDDYRCKIESISFEKEIDGIFYSKNLFKNFELIDPIDGSVIIGVEVE